MNVHYGDDELSAYALAPSLSAEAEAIEKHLAVCDECSGRLQFIGELDDAFRDPETWAAVDLLLTRPQRLAAAMAEYRRVEKEDAATLAGFSNIARMAGSLEVLLYELQTNPRKVTPSTLRTVGQVVDFMPALLRQDGSPDAEPSSPLILFSTMTLFRARLSATLWNGQTSAHWRSKTP